MPDEEQRSSCDRDFIRKEMFVEALEFNLVEEKMMIMNVLYKKKIVWSCKSE